jgi:hypothetical protein
VTSKHLVVALALLACASPRPASAQPMSADGAPDPEQVRIRIGPVWINPKISLSNFGIDTNVFNEPSDANPKRDFTLTVTPATDLWLRLGRSWLQLNVKEDVVWYQTYASERSANSNYTANWRMPLNRVLVTLSPTYLSTRERPGFEIDARSQRRELGGKGMVEVRALSKTFLGVNASWMRTDFDSVATFDGVNLRDALNRTVTTGGVSLRHQLTPLTALSVNVSREQDRFEFSSLRDSDSTRVTGAIAFDPYALIKGSATFGYRDFQPLSPGLPGYQGATAAVDLSYTLLGMTRFGVQAERDIQYSYYINQPYYLLTGISGSITQQIFGPFDGLVRAGAQRLAYQNRDGVFVDNVNRVDYVHTYGAGIGYRLSRDLRLGVNIDQMHRISDVSRRQYDGLRFGTSVTYGF